MNPIQITDIKAPEDFPCSVKVDKFVPIRFRTYETPIGLIYLNIGNRSTTLADIIVDPVSRILRGFTVTSFKPFVEWSAVNVGRALDGLPVLTGNWDKPEVPRLEYTVIDASVDFSCTLRNNVVLFFWDDLRRATHRSIFNNVRCYATDRELCGIEFADLTEDQIALLEFHGKRKVTLTQELQKR